MTNSEDYILTDSDVVQLLDAWCVENPRIQPTSQGTVNTTFFVDTLQGKFVFKLYDDSTTTAQIKCEHSLLAHLQSCDLSFTVPTPIPDSFGETLLAVNRNNCEQDLCKRDKTLVVRDTIKLITTFKIDKSVTAPYKLNNELRFTLQDINHIYASGKALGELHRALAEFDSQGKLAQLPSWRELDRIHPLITNPLEVPQLLNLEQQQQLEEIPLYKTIWYLTF